jgi:hypothetical protein
MFTNLKQLNAMHKATPVSERLCGYWFGFNATSIEQDPKMASFNRGSGK